MEEGREGGHLISNIWQLNNVEKSFTNVVVGTLQS